MPSESLVGAGRSPASSGPRRFLALPTGAEFRAHWSRVPCTVESQLPTRPWLKPHKTVRYDITCFRAGERDQYSRLLLFLKVASVRGSVKACSWQNVSVEMIYTNDFTGLHIFLFFPFFFNLKNYPIALGIQCGVVMQNQKGTLGGASKFSISKLSDQIMWLKLPLSSFFDSCPLSVPFRDQRA